MTVRATMYFSLRKGGWSESFYSGASVDSAYAAVAALAQKRITFLVDAASLEAYGVRSLDTARLSRLSGVNELLTGIAGATAYRDLYNAAVEARYDTATSVSKPWYHGCPDDYMVGDAAGNFILSAGGAAVINAYQAFLLGQGVWQLRVQTNGLTPTTRKVANITYAAGVVTMSLESGLIYAPGDKIVVTGCKGYRANQFNGTWKVVSRNVDDYVVANSNSLTTDFTYTKLTGKIRSYGYGFAGLTAVNINKIGTKKMGRPINAPVGRRRASRR